MERFSFEPDVWLVFRLFRLRKRRMGGELGIATFSGDGDEDALAATGRGDAAAAGGFSSTGDSGGGGMSVPSVRLKLTGARESVKRPLLPLAGIFTAWKDPG